MLKHSFGLIAALAVVALAVFVATTWSAYSFYGYRCFTSGTVTVPGAVWFALLTFVVPLAGFSSTLAVARRIVVRYKLKNAESFFLLVITAQFLANRAGLISAELAPHLPPLTAKGIKAASVIGIAMQVGSLYGVLLGAKQLWSGCQDEER